MSGPPPGATSGPPPGAEMPEPEPANLELLSSPAVRPATAGAVEDAFNGIVGGVSGATSERILGGLAEGGGPVRANVTEAEPVVDNSGNGQSPFFLAFLANLAGFGGAAVVFFGVARVADSLASRGMHPSRVGLWTVTILLGGLYTALVAGAEVGVAFGVVGVDHEADLLPVFLFLVLAIAALMAVVMLLTTLFGAAGIGIAAIFGVLLGLVSAGGLAPIEALPGFYQAYADWLPLRYINDGLRSLIFFDGRSAAGLGDAFRVLGGYLVGSVVLGYLAAFVKDLFARRKGRKGSGEVAEGSTG